MSQIEDIDACMKALGSSLNLLDPNGTFPSTSSDELLIKIMQAVQTDYHKLSDAMHTLFDMHILQSSALDQLRASLNAREYCEECDGLFLRETIVRRTSGYGNPDEDCYYLCKSCNEKQEKREHMDETITTPTEAPIASPHTEIVMSPNGMTVKITAQGLKIEFSFGEEDMNNIAGHWLETRREIKQQLLAVEKGK